MRNILKAAVICVGILTSPLAFSVVQPGCRILTSEGDLNYKFIDGTIFCENDAKLATGMVIIQFEHAGLTYEYKGSLEQGYLSQGVLGAWKGDARIDSEWHNVSSVQGQLHIGSRISENDAVRQKLKPYKEIKSTRPHFFEAAPKTDEDFVRLYEAVKKWQISMNMPFNDTFESVDRDGHPYRADANKLVPAVYEYCTSIWCLGGAWPSNVEDDKELIRSKKNEITEIAYKTVEIGVRHSQKPEIEQLTKLIQEYSARGPKGKYDLSKILLKGQGNMKKYPIEADALLKESSKEGYARATYEIALELSLHDSNAGKILMRTALQQGSQDAKDFFENEAASNARLRVALCQAYRDKYDDLKQRGKSSDALAYKSAMLSSNCK